MRIIILFILAVAFTIKGFGQKQHKIDSLSKVVAETKGDTAKVSQYLKLYQLFTNSDLLKAKAYTDSAFQFALKSKDLDKIANVNFSYGHIYFSKSNYNLSLDYFIKYLKYSELIHNKKNIARVVLNIGSIHFSQKNYESALQYFERALTLMTEIEKENPKEALQKETVLNNIGLIYKIKGQFQSSLQYFEKALQLSLSNKNYENAGNVCNNLGDLYQTAGKEDSCLYFINKGIEYRKKCNDEIGLAKSYRNLAQYYFRNNMLDKAVETSKKALENAEKIGNHYLLLGIYNKLAEIYSKLGNYEAAYATQIKAQISNDSIFNERITREITTKEMEYEFEKREKQTQLEQQQKEFRYIILASVLTFLLILSGLLYFLAQSRAKRIQLQGVNLELEKNNLELEKSNLELEKNNLELENQKLHLDLELKNKELTTNIMYLLRKNELINDVTDQLLKLKKYLSKDNQDAFQNIILHLQTGADANVWEEFEYRFQQVHHGFYDKLREQYPDLSPSELKLCSFLRLNLSSKEISAITHQNIRSIEVARTRLRKKLNITNQDVNLVNFLMDF